MKLYHLCPTLLLHAILVLPLQSQDSSTEKLMKEGANLLNDPRLKNMLQQAQESPEAAAAAVIENIKTNPDKADDVVREATRVFQENREEIEEAAQNLKKNQSTIEAAANSAIEEFGRVSPANSSPVGDPSIAPTGAGAPATRSVGSVTLPPTSIPPNSEAAAIPRPAATASEKPIMQNTEVTPIATAPKTVPTIPDSRYLNPGDFPEPAPLAPIYQVDAQGGFQPNPKNEVNIFAGESEMNNNTKVLTLTQNVVIEHPEFTLECDKLLVTLAEGESQEGDSTKFKRAVATGGTVRIRRISPEGKTQVAISRMAEYNGITKDFILSGGPPYIQDGEKHVRCDAPDAQIVMTGDGKYKITGSDAGAPSRHKITFPVEDEGGTKTIGIGNGVGGSLNRLR